MEINNRDILFLCQYSYPEVNSSATLPFDTARALASSGKKVDVLCGWPKEYSKRKRYSAHETVDGVDIHRLRYLQLSRVGKLGRIVNFVSFTLAELVHIGALRKYNCVMVYSNPPILPMVCSLANAMFGTKYVFVVYDVYPEIASTTGQVSDSGMIARYMQRLNNKVFSRASAVVALSEEMRDYLLNHRPTLAPERVFVIPNWAHEETAASVNRVGGDGELVVSYFGNLGVCQDTDTMLEAMELLKDEKKIRFLIAAHGSRLSKVQERAKHLKNVEFLDYLTGDEFTETAAKCNCGIVSLGPGLSGMCSPSKYYSYLQSGQAVLAVMDTDAGLAHEVCSEQIGAAVAPGDGVHLAQHIREMAAHPHETAQMGFRARALYERRYSRAHAMRAYEQLLNAVINGAKNKER